MPGAVRRAHMDFAVELLARKRRVPGYGRIVVVEEIQSLVRVERLDARARPLAERAAPVYKYIVFFVAWHRCSRAHYTLSKTPPVP